MKVKTDFVWLQNKEISYFSNRSFNKAGFVYKQSTVSPTVNVVKENMAD